MSELNRSTRANDGLHLTGNPLDVLFSPRSVAVIGATEREGSVGRIVINHLLSTSYTTVQSSPLTAIGNSVFGLSLFSHNRCA